MNYWDYEETGSQTFSITPREHEPPSGGLVPFTVDTTLYSEDSTLQTADQTQVGSTSVIAFTADTTLYTADTTLYTADQTQIGSGGSVYVVEYDEDGVYDNTQTANASGVVNGSFLDLTATLSLNADTFYYFRVYVDDTTKPEIFRGKAFTYDVLPSKPLHFSMYDDNEIN